MKTFAGLDYIGVKQKELCQSLEIGLLEKQQIVACTLISTI